MITKRLLTAFCVLCTYSCAKVHPRSQLTDILPHNPTDFEPELGAPYDSLIQEARSSKSCVIGEPLKVSTASSMINIYQNIDQDRVMREFTGEVQGTPRLAFLEAGTGLGYYRSINRQKTTINLVYAVKIIQGSEKLHNVKIKDEWKSQSSISLFEQCGDHYVSQINRGGILAITVTFDFTDETSRNKWQSKLKTNGTWGDFSKDLLDKIERGGIESNLSVQVTQIGGTPSEAVLAAKSCSLLTTEDFNQCKQKIDELMAYANSGFPQQIDAHPAVLQYITSPLQSLGARDLPVLTQAVLDARRELELLNLEATRLFDMSESAKASGLDFDPKLANAIRMNKDRIREAAKLCFNYGIKPKALDWEPCFQQVKGIRSRLEKVDSSRTIMHELIVPASSEWGNSIINPYTTPMEIVYTVVSGKKWRIEPGMDLDTAGLNSQGKGSRAPESPAPSIYRGALVRYVEGRYELSDLRDELRIPPGEAIQFLINDTIGAYANNSGDQVISWRCTNCSDQQAEVPTHRLRIRAEDADGVIFRSQNSASSKFKVFAYGTWRGSLLGSNHGPKGAQSLCGSSCPLPTAPWGALIMQEADKKSSLIGSGAEISIRSTVHFLMNDSSYSDNYGAIEAIVQCPLCKPGTYESEL